MDLARRTTRTVLFPGASLYLSYGLVRARAWLAAQAAGAVLVNHLLLTVW